jgi:ParB-like nuclease domain
MTRPVWVWHLPLRQQSDEILRAVMAACRCYLMPCRGLDYMALDPATHGQSQTPILVRADGARFVLVEGLHRLEAAKALGERTIVGFRVEARKH